MCRLAGWDDRFKILCIIQYRRNRPLSLVLSLVIELNLYQLILTFPKKNMYDCTAGAIAGVFHNVLNTSCSALRESLLSY